MKTFVRVVEVWVPSKDGSCLELSEGFYGTQVAFRDLSRTMRFARGEGLPGQAWETGRPVVLRSFEGSFFMRTEAAKAAGLASAVALPFFDGAAIASVVVLFCADDPDLIGAIEVWETDADVLRLRQGFYGSASTFEWVSNQTSFRPGCGLPGTVWASGLPQILPDLGRTSHFMRAEAALRVGIEHGLGIPCGRGDDLCVVTLLSGKETPIAERIEIWIPAAAGDAVDYHDGYCDRDPDFDRYPPNAILRGEGAIGRALATRRPTISNDLGAEPGDAMRRSKKAGLDSALALPILCDDALCAIVTLYAGAADSPT